MSLSEIENHPELGQCVRARQDGCSLLIVSCLYAYLSGATVRDIAATISINTVIKINA